ncbi:DUF4139 domain-containing protein [Crenalkalicoccus roseus]|uniref:DUF4139 domain-containing protein n=1 Tax=Crenalkalicoccus roseus TaxID=1485588 RepID=UPI0010817F5F|nr:DUF4139 domain-containing protein [Crenalkalicoccus roseus]
MRRLLLPLLLPLPVLAAELPVRSVTLSSAGLMQVERAGMLPPEAPVTLAVPAADVDDVLKSLLIRDPAGTVRGLRLPAQDLAAEAFRGLPLRPEDFDSRAALLRALRGQAVEAGGVTGRLADAAEGEQGLGLSLLTPEGLRLLVLREGEAVRLADPDLAARVARAAEALAAARSEDWREIEIRLAGAAAPREVAVVTVTPAPLWKPSWRLLLPEGAGQARLQGWAVVENRSGADWEGVRITLVSDSPAAYRQPLYAPIEVPRPEVPVRMAETIESRPDPGPLPPPPAVPRPRAPVRAAAATLAAVAEAAPSASPGRVAFTLPEPARLRSGETANLPFLDAALPAERLWWVQDMAAPHPLQAARLANTTGHVLPGGLATLYAAETGAWLGDAEILAMAPGEARLLAFARDREVRLAAASGAEEVPAGVSFRRGAVLVATLRREEAALAVDPRGRAGRLVVDLPRRPGLDPRFPVAAEGEFGLRHEAVLDGAPRTLRFAWEQEGREEIPLWDPGLGDPLLLRWRALDPEQALPRLPGGAGALERLRELLGRLPPGAPGGSELAALVEELGAARRLLDAARAAIRRHAIAEEALRRAREAVEDRSGPAREEARRALNAASLEAERAGAAADAAWDAWRQAVQAVLARTG